jgi:P4 family phage/plasmid primase-like protien
MSATDLKAFLNAHKREKDSEDQITNTRIGDKKGIYGGSYSISDLDYTAFLNKYRKEIVEQPGAVEYLTETQLPSDGPILIDLDFRFDFSVVSRIYGKDHIDDLVGAYIDEIAKMFQFDETSSYDIYVLEKPAVNRVEELQVTKDGLHLIIGISAERKMQIVLRSRMVAKLVEMWGGEDGLPITNTWAKVLDDGIAQGHTGWQLYGSRKPGCDAYELTHIYSVRGFDPADRQPIIECVSKGDKEWKPDWKDLLPKLSARCRSHPKFFYRGEFAKELDAVQLPRKMAAGSSPIARQSQMAASATYPHTLAVSQVRYKDELDAVIENYNESLKEAGDWNTVELYMYAMGLPESYYGSGSYDKWIRVGIALKNSNDSTFPIWVAFSAKSATFDYSGISAMLDKWNSFDTRRSAEGITKRSIIYWCRSDAPKEYNAIRIQCANATLERVMGNYEDINEDAKIDQKGTTDCDLAEVLHTMYGDEYKCVSITNNIWYKYNEPRWIKIDAGVNLRKNISGPLRALYDHTAIKYISLRANLSEDEDPRKIKKIDKRIEKLLSVYRRLGSTSDKKNIMTEAKELFYDREFLEKLDANPYLLCFKNGVVDFKQKTFRRGTPEDYLTKCTNTDYIQLNPETHQHIIEEIRDFMWKLFPDKEIHDYMWEHLASSLIGVLPNQTWNIYIGDGQNGKSMLIKAMEYVLGEYKGSIPINLLTDRRGKIGGAAPEIVSLKGLRMAVAQEPQKGDRINDGVVKQLTSGIDTIQGRGLYMAQSEEFYPQFELVLCTNYLMEIQSNDHGTWRRIRVVPFKSLFTDNPVEGDQEKPYQFKIDRNLEERLAGWKEVFASMLVEITYQRMGKVADCEMVMAASNAYRQSQDCIAEFIADRTTVDVSGSITKTELSVEFKVWYETTYGRRGGPNIKEVQAYMDKKFKKFGKVWTGVRVVYERDMRSEVEDNDVQEPAEF